jgi:glycerophosphoryl diester phosphodiesterase
MARWTFVNYLAAGLVLIPLLSSILGMLVFRGGRVIGNEDLVGWVLHPVGMLYLLSAGALAIAGGVIRYAGLFRILIDDIDGRSVSLKQTVIELVPDVPALLRLCAVSIALALALVTPLLAMLGVVYFVLLRAHDINYYLAETPPEWTSALVLGGSLLVVWAVPAVYVILRTLPALPAFLDGYRPIRRAVQESWVRTKGEAARALWLFALCVILWLVVRVSLHGAYALAASPAWRLIDSNVTSVTPLLLATIVWAAGTFVIDIVVSFIGFSIAATVLTKFYFEDTDLHRKSPSIPLGLKALPRRAGMRLLWWLHPLRMLPMLAAILLVSVIASALLLRPLTEEVHFEIAAHRGGAFIGVENTLATLERAIDFGSDYAEIDLQLTADSVVVVVHDADMMRLAGDPRRIDQLTLDELLGIRLLAPDGAPEDELRIATLDEYLERSRGRFA